MKHVTDYQSEWMREVETYTSELRFLQHLIDPLEDKLDTLYAKMDAHCSDKPSWHDCVIEPIILALKDVFIVKDLWDRTQYTYPIMVIAPRTGQDSVALNVMFRMADTSTGAIKTIITGYSPAHGAAEMEFISNNSTTVEHIIKQIEKVRDQL